jgi:aminopeptidase N
MEDASGVDLDWFWRGWFFTNEHVDISIAGVEWYRIDTRNPDIEKPLLAQEQSAQPPYITDLRNLEEIEQTQDEIDPDLRDFYSEYDPWEVNILDRQEYQKYVNRLSEEERVLLETGHNYYELTFENLGGLVMPIIVEFRYADGESEIFRIPAEIWRYDHERVTKVFVTEQEAVEIVLDPYLETADVDTGNNYYPPRTQMDRFQLFRQRNYERGKTPCSGKNELKNTTKVIIN